MVEGSNPYMQVRFSWKVGQLLQEQVAPRDHEVAVVRLHVVDAVRDPALEPVLKPIIAARLNLTDRVLR